MVICDDCELVFDEPKEFVEDRTPGGVSEGGSFLYHYIGCPNCGGMFEVYEEPEYEEDEEIDD